MSVYASYRRTTEALTMGPQQHEQELAHVLLTELLAYQFAMPVRWSETQSILFDNINVEKLVEFGPSPTLLSMAKKTLGQFNLESDAVNGIKRSLLSTSANYDDLRYDVPPPPEPETTESSPKPVSESSKPVSEAPVAQVAPPAKSDSPIPDVPVSALESVTALIASSLKKSASDIKLEDSIKFVSGGRSIVQNEIIGDMLEEFGPLADDVENIPLKELASTIQGTYDGKLKKCLRTRIEKMIGSKMPGSFDLISVRSYLSDKWGLASGRQDAILLIALGQQPSTRLKKNEDAESFFDSITQKYLDDAGLSRQRSATTASPQQTMLDSKVVQQIREEHSQLRRKIAALLSDDEESLPLSTSGGDLTEIQDKLDTYEKELGEDFCNGIKPIFKADHQRSYDSVWNWGHVDLLEEYYNLLENSASQDGLESAIDGLRNRASSRLKKARQYLLSKCCSLEYKGDEGVQKMLDKLSPKAINHINNRPPIVPLEARNSNIDGRPEGEVRAIKSPHILRRKGASWTPNQHLTTLMNLDGSVTSKMFSGKDILLTGAGPNSIGIVLLQSLLQEGARVVVTTTRAMPEAGPIYQKIFARHGADGSKLVVLPCNQGSKQDIENLITHIYDPTNGLGWDLDFIIPFAALAEKGREIDNIDSRSELAHRAMLTNVVRLMGAVKVAKESRGFRTRPAQVLLPLSPNHGTFGSDGLYSESKIGLMTLLNKWSSENWSDYLCLCGVIIGWTRGTGLMAANDAIAEEIAKRGVTTFSTEEMGKLIIGLMSDPVVSICQTECLLADFSGGMGSDPELAAFIAGIRNSMRQDEEIRRALADEEALDEGAIRCKPTTAPQPNPAPPSPPLVDLELGFPALPDYSTKIKPLNSKLDGMADLESVVVVVGFAEIGPWGNSRTRWEMELEGEFSIQGCIELAWMTGLIKHNQKPAPSANGAAATWIDAATDAPVHDREIKAKYEKQILEHTGLRLIEPSPLDHPNRDSKQFLQEVIVQHDLEPFSASFDTAMEFVREHGDKVKITQIAKSDQFSVHVKKGATLMIPKARIFDRIVGGQLPTGWDPTIYGLPQDLCESVDRCTQMALVCAAETFLSAGITDIYELYKTIHISELANCVGSGMGGGQSLQKLYRQRFLDRPVQSDILAEVFINTTGAWLNMLLMSSAGPTRTPVGACATALESLNQGFDLITSGAAKICLVGGFDDMTQDTSAEFANMKATNNSMADLERGRAPHETSRPCASSRKGFVESEGCGMQLLTSAKIALDLGLPIRSIVAHVQTASDGTGRSVPAPGKGIMVNVRETPNPNPSPLLDIDYRRRLLSHTLKSIRERQELFGTLSTPNSLDELTLATQREEKEARRRFGNSFHTHDTRISPLRGALAVWNLTADDIGVVSLHGTSTDLNEKNEVEVLHRQLQHLGRTPGNAALAVCQKYLTGHPKGAAAAWMLNGCCQILESGLVPGNRNLDNVDSALERWENLVFPDRTIRVGEVNAFSVTSFGFGQKGAQALGVHPQYVFATIGAAEYSAYARRRGERYARAKQHFQNTFYGGSLVVLKDSAPYSKEEKLRALTDASARFG
ncbi:putative 3-oxoacyl-synthase [Annulohypoxylon maeteangense]|uniref:putative 3-oxoacyl-synthase n=1 Tax=Annulohypoxylon maeteangense TaxID=1927788 RepID=UPI0020076328|nr:putative 3-oxoacyl-synthase [Annulohypoxylon maeteangense]KAI0881212.1 putative 3-oxoacyl-synthase [Annulohypoxylon maeteangense]